MRLISLAAAAIALALTPFANANVIYSEAASGDLSSDGLNPTVLAVQNGSNQVIGSVIAAPGDRDFFSITLGASQSLDIGSHYS